MLVGDAGSILGDIGNAGTVVFEQASGAIFAGDIAGLGGPMGAMVKNGVGTLTLAGTSTLNWSIDGGGLVSSADRFSGDVAIGAAGRLTFDQDSRAIYAGMSPARAPSPRMASAR